MSQPGGPVFRLLRSAAVLLLALAPAGAFQPPEIHPRRLLFGLKPGHRIAEVRLPPGATLLSPSDRLPALADDPAAPRLLDSGAPEFHVVLLAADQQAEPLRRTLAAHPAVAYVEYDGIGQGGAVTPDDPEFSRQWHHPIIGSPDAWEVTQGSPAVTLAVLDTGINLTLPDFVGRLVRGYDFVNSDTTPSDDHGHGSSVTAVAAGSGNNGEDSAGVDWNCRIMPVKVLDSSNNGFYSWWADGIRFAADRGADVINLSAGGASSSTTLENAIDYAIGKGVIFVTITHNDSSGTIRFPGRLPQAITVGATRANDVASDFSNYGEAIDLVAPGGIGSSNGSFATNVVSTNFNGETRWFWGTSYAAPQVAGAATLLRGLRPDLRQADMEALLSASADDQVGDENDTPGFDPHYGYGRLNLPAALSLLQSVPEFVMADDALQVRWPSPSNATSKQPFGIEFSEDLEGWTRLPALQNMAYRPGLAVWIDDGSETGTPPGSSRYYRWFIRR